MHLKKFLNAIEQIAPIQLAESWDNVGLLVESPIPRQNATATFLCIDLTPSVLSEALKNPKVGIICAYHPPLFSSIKRLDLKSQSVILNCIANGISIYSPHTSLDSTRNGINDWLSRLIGKGTVKPIIPNTTNAEIGAGRILTLSKPVLLSELIDRVKIGLNLNHVRVAGTLETSISTVAICAGSGTGLLKGVVADLWITGEMGHHDVLSGLKQGTCVILTEHSNSERGYLKDVLVDLLKAQGVEDVVVSAQDQDPLRDEIKYSQVNDSNINLLKSLNSILFPVSYNESFYNDVLNTYPKHLSLLAYHNNNLIAAICCREEDDRVYIMTFGVIETYRRFKIGSKLLQKIIAQIELYNDLELSRVCLHVHVLNNVAIGFYLNNGFRREEYIEGYYKRNVGVEPPDAYLLVRDLINKN